MSPEALKVSNKVIIMKAIIVVIVIILNKYNIIQIMVLDMIE